MNRVIVTGASGFIGRHCIPHLLDAGFKVIGFYHTASEKSLPSASNLEWHKVDLLDQSAVQLKLQEIKATHLLHLAWYSEPNKFWDSRLNMDWLRASLYLLKTFTECGGKRFVGAGSCAEYDWSAKNFSETTQRNPATLFGQCKNAFFQSATQNASAANTEFAWGRIFWLYGPGEDRRRSVPYVINSLFSDDLAACAEGAQIRDFMHVDDVARAFTLLVSSRIQGAINIASGVPVRIKTVFQTIGQLLDKEHLIELGAVPTERGEPLVVVAVTTRLKTELKFEPQIKLDDGLLSTLRWWQEERKRTIEDYRKELKF